MHTDTHYVAEVTRKEGREVVTEIVRVRWEDFNKTELVAVAIREHEGTALGHQIWDVAHPGCRTADLISMIRGEVPEDLPVNPVHRLREAIHNALRDNWRYLKSQVRCDTNCANCLDAQPVSCYLENKHLMRPNERDHL